MKTICSEGFKISNSEKKSLEHCLLEIPKQWSQNALKGMINKAIKTILKDYFDKYKESQENNINLDLEVLIPNIIAMQSFKPYNIETPSAPQINIKQSRLQEIWLGGFIIEDYEDAALKAYYEDPESMLRWFMENKIHLRKKAMIKEYLPTFIKEKKIIPTHDDDIISMIVSENGYKNRIQKEALNGAN